MCTSSMLKSLVYYVSNISSQVFYMLQLEAKSLKCKDEKIKADDIYKGLVRQLEVTRASWETEMETMCDTFQQVENDRILFFRNELWALTNFDSKTLFDQDQV